MSLVPKAELISDPDAHDQLVNPAVPLWHNPMVVQLPGILPSSSLSTTDPASTGSASTSSGNGVPQDSPGSSHPGDDLSGDAEGVWAPDIDQAFHEALQIYPPCGRRKIILSDEGKMYGRNELIARYIKIRCGKTRTRKQVSSHIQVLARKKHREMQAKIKGQNSDAGKHMDTTSPQSVPKPPPMSLGTPPGLYNGTGAQQPINPTSLPTTAQAQNGGGLRMGQLEHPKPLKIETGNIPDTLASVLNQAAVASLGQATAGMPQPAAGMPSGWPYNPHTLQSMFPSMPPYYTSLNPEESLYQQMIAQTMAAAVASTASAVQMPPLSNGKTQPLEENTISSSKLTLREFVAYVQGPGQVSKTDLLRIPRVYDEQIEEMTIELIQEKYPLELRDLFEKGPSNAFFLVKCWANANFDIPNDERSANYAVDSYYEAPFNFDISVSTKVCSFGKQVVEKVEIYSPVEGTSNGISSFHFKVENSPMCDYMVRFIAELKKLGTKDGVDIMNNVLENFTVLQIVTNKESGETLMVIAFVIEVSNDNDDPSCRIYRLVN